MKNKKKWLMACMAAAVAVSFTACSRGRNGQSTSESTPGQSTSSGMESGSSGRESSGSTGSGQSTSGGNGSVQSSSGNGGAGRESSGSGASEVPRSEAETGMLDGLLHDVEDGARNLMDETGTSGSTGQTGGNGTGR